MNEVKSGVNGVVEEVLHTDGHPVEYGENYLRLNHIKNEG